MFHYSATTEWQQHLYGMLSENMGTAFRSIDQPTMHAHKLDVEGITNGVHYTFILLMQNSIKASAGVFRAGSERWKWIAKCHADYSDVTWHIPALQNPFINYFHMILTRQCTNAYKRKIYTCFSWINNEDEFRCS
jgi:hypothetical protein